MSIKVVLSTGTTKAVWRGMLANSKSNAERLEAQEILDRLELVSDTNLSPRQSEVMELLREGWVLRVAVHDYGDDRPYFLGFLQSRIETPSEQLLGLMLGCSAERSDKHISSATIRALIAKKQLEMVAYFSDGLLNDPSCTIKEIRYYTARGAAGLYKKGSK